MCDIFDVAKYILNKLSYISTMKLQKLAYYSQAYSLVRTGEPIFLEDFQAWVNGPVCRELFQKHKGLLIIGYSDLNKGNEKCLSNNAKEIVDFVIDKLGNESGRKLSEFTHREKPWIDARAGIKPNEKSDNIIDKKSILNYYLSCKTNPLFA